MKYFSLIIVCFSLFSCTSKFSKGKYVIDTIHPVITLDRYEKEFDLQDFIENISYCKLETSPESLLGNIDKMMVDSSSLFIFDRYTCNALYRFSRSGKFITKFGKQGRGPEEYIEIYDFDVDFDNKQVLLFDLNGRKIQYYSFDGEYLRTRKVDFLATEFKCNRQFIGYKIESSYNPSVKHKKYILLDTLDEKEYTYFDSRDIPKKFSYTLSNTMNKYNGHIYISPRYANSIYKLDSCYLKEYIHVRLKDSIDSKTLKTITDEKFEILQQTHSYLDGGWVILADYSYLKMKTPKGLYNVCISTDGRLISGYTQKIHPMNPLLTFFSYPIAGWETELIQPVSSSIVLDQKNMLYILAQDNLKVMRLLDDLYKDVSENSNQIVFFYQLKKIN